MMSSMELIIICVIFIIIWFLASLLVKYLIKANKIESSKLSRIFYTDDETFIKKWEKYRKQSKFKFFLCNLITMIITYLVTSFIFLLLRDSGLSLATLIELIDSELSLVILIGLIISTIIGTPIRWSANEDKYYYLINNRINN